MPAEEWLEAQTEMEGSKAEALVASYASTMRCPRLTYATLFPGCEDGARGSSISISITAQTSY